MTESEKKLFKKSISHILLSSLTGLLIFLILLALANYLINYMDSSALSQSVWFLNNNIDLILVIFAVFLIAEIFGAVVFPFNLPAPLFNAAGSVLLVDFISKVFYLTASITKESVFYRFAEISSSLGFIVFIIVLFAGYFLIFMRVFKENKAVIRNKKEDVEDREDKRIYSEQKEEESENIHRNIPDTKYCIKCGSKINSGDRFCFGCGKEQDDA